MKNLQSTEQSAQTSKKIINRLMTINRLIRSNENRESGYQMLSEVEEENLTPNQIVYCHYLNARYYMSCFQQDGDIEHLEYAHDFLNDLVHYAFENKVRITNPRIHFTRANVKFQLAQVVWEKERVEWLLIKAKNIITRILSKDPKNDEFLLLQKQLSA